MKTKYFFFTATILNAVIWLAVIPVFHTPDEQAHFGQVAFVASKWRSPDYRDKKDLTEEIYIAEKLLGTERDIFGNNRFTFHPEYKIDYSDSFVGIFEENIKSLADSRYQNNFIIKESSRYPVLYYLPAAVIYNLFLRADIFYRITAVRFLSLVFYFLAVYFSYKLAKLIFKEKNIALIPAVMIAFQPMYIFANIGVTSDSLGNLMFAVFLYLTVLLIKNGMNLNLLIIIIGEILFSVYIKPQFGIMIPVFLLVIVFLVLRDRKKIRYFRTVFFLLMSAIPTSIAVLYYLRAGTATIAVNMITKTDWRSLYKYTKEYIIFHTYSEVMPWYWGIYDWLGVTYPRIVHRIINWTVLISIIGFVIKLIRTIKKNLWPEKTTQLLIYLVSVSVMFLMAVSYYDWFNWFTTSYPLGVQGRYLFPVLPAHIMVLFSGWHAVLFFNKSARLLWNKLLGIMMVILNYFALYTVANTYYDLSSLNSFIIQASQYKPWFFKGFYLQAFLFLALTVNLVFLIKYLQYPSIYGRKNNQKD